MAAISANLAFILVFGLMLQGITRQETYEYDLINFFKVAIFTPLAAGIPGGILYGLQRKNKGDTKTSRIGFWLFFWLFTTLLFIIQMSFFILPDVKNIAAAAVSLFLFAWIWTYLMEVIYDNPLSFDHLISNDQPVSRKAVRVREQPQPCQSSALIRKRKG